MSKTTSKVLYGALLLASGIVTYVAIQQAMAYTGGDLTRAVVIGLGAFLVAVGLVFAAVIVRAKGPW